MSISRTDPFLVNLPSYQQEIKDTEREALRADALERYTRFLRLSYYLSRK